MNLIFKMCHVGDWNSQSTLTIRNDGSGNRPMVMCESGMFVNVLNFHYYFGSGIDDATSHNSITFYC
jgi:hypothetical protein